MSHKKKDQVSRQETSPAFQPGRVDNPTAIMLSTPGLAEKAANRPAAGQTGKTLDNLLKILHQRSPRFFPFENKDDYTIVNASDEIHPNESTERTEATIRSMKTAENRQRVADALEGKTCIVTLGRKPGNLIDALGLDAEIVKAVHPSLQALNRKYSSDESTPPERAADRLKQYAAEILINAKKKKK